MNKIRRLQARVIAMAFVLAGVSLTGMGVGCENVDRLASHGAIDEHSNREPWGFAASETEPPPETLAASGLLEQNPYGCRGLTENPHYSEGLDDIAVHARSWCNINVPELKVIVALQEWALVWVTLDTESLISPNEDFLNARASDECDGVPGYYRGSAAHGAIGPDGNAYVLFTANRNLILSCGDEPDCPPEWEDLGDGECQERELLEIEEPGGGECTWYTYIIYIWDWDLNDWREINRFDNCE